MFSHIVIDIQYTFIIHYLHIIVHRPHHFIILPLSLLFPELIVIRILHSTQLSTPPAPIAAGRLGGFPFWLRPSEPGCRLSDAPSSVVVVCCCTSPPQVVVLMCVLRLWTVYCRVVVEWLRHISEWHGSVSDGLSPRGGLTTVTFNWSCWLWNYRNFSASAL